MLAIAITNQWYNGEVSNFLPSYYGQPTPDLSSFDSWGHFTQVVWKGSTTAGCATQYCAPGTIFSLYASWYTVCNYVPQGDISYSPARETEVLTAILGNYLGEFNLNVGLPSGQPSIFA